MRLRTLPAGEFFRVYKKKKKKKKEESQSFKENLKLYGTGVRCL